MGATYTRQSSYTDGDVITAAHTNDEFDQLLAVFQKSTGHVHDGTDNEGGVIADLIGNAITIGSKTVSGTTFGTLNSDTTLTFNSSDTNSGVLSWDTSADLFQFSDDILIIDNEQLIFGSDSNVAISYDEATTDSLKIAATEGAGLAITLMADEGDDAGDEWKLNIADGGTLTFGNDIASAGTYVTHLTLTPNSTVASSTLAVAGNLTVGGSLTLGSGAELAEAELEMLDGITAGTVAASKAMVVDANRDIGTVRNLTIDGTFSDGNYTFDDSGNVSGLGNVTSTGIITGASLVVDNFTLNGTELDLSSGDFTLDVAGDIILNTDDGIVSLQDDSATFGSLENSSGNLVIKSGTTTALTFSGANATIAGDLTISGDDLTMGTNTSGHIMVADGTNFNPVAVSGDVTIASNGAVTIASTAVENSMLAGSIADSKLSTITTADKVSGAAIQIDGATDGTSITIADADKFLIDDGGTTKYVTASQINAYTSAAVALDDISTGDAAVTLATSSGNITIDAQANNTDIIFKGTDATSDITMLTLDGSEAGDATFNSSVTVGSLLKMPDNTSAKILVADGTSFQEVAVSGDVTIANTGAVTIASSAVENAMLAGSIADTKLNTISTAGKVALSALEIDGGTDIGAALVDADLIVVDDGAGGTNRKAAMSRVATYIESGISGDISISSGTAAIGSGVIVNADINSSAAIADSKLATISTAGKVALSSLEIDGGTDVGADLVDADLIIVDDGAGGNNEKSELTRVKKYIYSAMSGDATASDAGAVTIANGAVENAMLAGSIANSKLANSSITVADASSSTAVSLGGTVTFLGTSNEVEVGESSGTVTIGLPDNVTIAGNLTVSGTTTTVNSTTVNLNDHNIVLDSGNSTSSVVNGAGITIEGGSGDDATFTYNTSSDQFELKLGSSYENLQVDQLTAATGSTIGNLTLANGSITDSSGAIDFGNETLTTTGAVDFGAATLDSITVTGDYTTTGQATDWDLIDNNASALSFDASGKTGILNIVTTNSSEGVTMSGTLGVTGATTTAAITASGVVDITDATDASNATGDTGALRTEGGASIAKKLYVGTDLDVNGTANLDDVDIDGAVDMATTLGVTGNLTLGAKLIMPDVTNAKILVSDGTSYEEVAVSGDVTIANTGAVTIASSAVENSMLAGSIAASKLAGSIGDSKLSTISTAGKVALSALEIDGGTDIGAALTDSDLLIVDDGAGGTNRKVALSRVKTYVEDAAGEVPIANLDIDGGTDIGADLVDADEIIVDDGGGGTNRRSDLTRVKKYIYSAMSGDATASDAGAVTIAANAVEGSMLNNNVISGQTALTSGLATTDELLVSDGGALKRMDVSVLKAVTDDSATALAIALG